MALGKRIAGVLAAAALAATGACSTGEGPEPADDAARLVELINEGHRLESELEEAELRVLRHCLEGQGHTVHDMHYMQSGEPAEVESLTDDWYPHEEYLPSAEHAQEWAFGQWTGTEAAQESGEAERYQNEMWGEDVDPLSSRPDIDNGEFAALSPEEQYDWYVAYFGPEIAERDYGRLLESGADPDEGVTDEEGADDAETADDGAIELEDGATEEPRPDGCLGEMVEVLYGEALPVVDAEDPDAAHTTWEWGPQHPETEEGWNDLHADYRGRIEEEAQAFIDCLAEEGLGEWTFDEHGTLPVRDYFYSIYGSEATGATVGADVMAEDLPEPPEDLAGDYEAAKAHEFALAGGFVDCGDRSGLAEASRQAWEEAEVAYYLAMEEELFAWQEEMKDAVARAQEFLDA